MDKFTKKKRSEIMSRIRGKNTRPKLVLRKALWSEGFRYRVHYGEEKIDKLFPQRRWLFLSMGAFGINVQFARIKCQHPIGSSGNRNLRRTLRGHGPQIGS